MIITTTAPITGITASPFGMPAPADLGCATFAGVMPIERDRVSVKGHLGLAQGTVPGLHAWSPPS